jgi:hypothetical protein
LQLAAIGWNKRSHQKGAFQPVAKPLAAGTTKFSYGGAKMGLVMIKCPETGRAISTGMEADRERFRCSPVFFARTFCLICKTSHEWFAREAWVHEPDAKRRGPRTALALQPA